MPSWRASSPAYDADAGGGQRCATRAGRREPDTCPGSGHESSWVRRAAACRSAWSSCSGSASRAITKAWVMVSRRSRCCSSPRNASESARSSWRRNAMTAWSPTMGLPVWETSPLLCRAPLEFHVLQPCDWTPPPWSQIAPLVSAAQGASGAKCRMTRHGALRHPSLPCQDEGLGGSRRCASLRRGAGVVVDRRLGRRS